MDFKDPSLRLRDLEDLVRRLLRIRHATLGKL